MNTHPTSPRALLRSPQASRNYHKANLREPPPTPQVTITGNEYLVDLGEDAPDRIHRVSKDKRCSCGLPDCDGIAAVRQYLLAGGARAPDTVFPANCPICGAKTFADADWDGKYTHEPGWRCSSGGLRHFLQAKAERIQRHLAANPWLIPPVPGDPGIRRDEILTWEECQAINHKIFQETGYDPTR